jgi:anti-sigma B factor antagonist
MAATARTLERLTVAPITGGWRVGGEVDANTAPALAEALATHRPDLRGERLVVDLADIGFMDSSGLAALLDARGRLAASGGVLVLRRPSRCVVRLLEITHLRRAFRVEQQRIVVRHHARRRRASTHLRRRSHR